MSGEAVAHPVMMDEAPAPASPRRGRAAALVLTVALVVLWPALSDVSSRPVRAVLVAGEFHHLSRAALESAVAAEVAGVAFLAVDVEAVRRAALALPWVREVAVRRVWPDRLQIAVVERGAVALWNELSLLEEDGALFTPEAVGAAGAPVELAGPEGRHDQVLDRLRELEAAIAGSALAPIVRLELEARGTWRIALADGAEVVLGHEQGVHELARFARAATALGEAYPAGFERADLRYSNGFAVRWREVPEAPSAQPDGVDG